MKKFFVSISPSPYLTGKGRYYTLDGLCISVPSDSSVLPRSVYIYNSKKVVIKLTKYLS